MRLVWNRTLLCACIAAGTILFSHPAHAQTDVGKLTSRLESYRFGSDAGLFDSIAQAVTESRNDPSRRVALAKGFAAVLKSDASFDAKQMACRQLAFIGTEEQLDSLAPLLQDKHLAHYALMAMARIPGRAVDDSLVKALRSAQGRARIEIMDTLAARGVGASVPAIAASLTSPDPEVGAAAAAALGKLGTPNAAAALRRAFDGVPASQKMNIANGLLAAAGRLAAQGDRSGPASIYAMLEKEAPAPIIGAAALRGLVTVRGDQGLNIALRALAEDGSARQLAAAGILRQMKGRQVTTTLASQLTRMSHRTQVYALEVLADRGEPAASSAVTALARGEDAGVRAAAIRALGSVGDESALPMLLQTAASGAADEQEAARESLARIRGTGVDAKLLSAIAQGDPAQRIEAIKAAGLRRTPADKALLDAAAAPDRKVSVAALRVLRDSAGAEQLPELVGLLLAKPAGERDEAIEAVSEIARRGADDSQRTAAIIARYDVAAKPADRADLLTALSQVGGPTALQALQKAESDASPDVRSTALRLLAEWPTDEPMTDLLKAYRSSQSANEKALALRGYIRMISMNDQRTPEQALALYKAAAAGAAGPAEKRLVLSGLGKLGSLEALEFARGFLSDEAVRPEAEMAVTEISRSTLGAYPAQTRQALEPIARDSTNEATRARARESVALLDKLGDFITTWEVSPQYVREGADFARLFDMPFPPEEPGGTVAWRLMPVLTNPEQPWLLDLLALYPGEQKVAYLRTAVWSDTARDIVLELGSDDGVKAWWNGQVVLSHNIPRAVAPGQEKVKVQAKQGWNQLMLKVNQNNQGWGAVARVTNADGTPAAGLRFAVPSAAK